MTNSLEHEIGSALIAPDKLLFDPEALALSTPVTSVGDAELDALLEPFGRDDASLEELQAAEAELKARGWRVCEYIHRHATHAFMPTSEGVAKLLDLRTRETVATLKTFSGASK